MCPHNWYRFVVIERNSLIEETQKPFVFEICINQGDSLNISLYTMAPASNKLFR